MNKLQVKAIKTINELEVRALNGDLGAMQGCACAYVQKLDTPNQTYRYCAIGALLTPEELKTVDDNHLMYSGSRHLYNSSNVKEVTDIGDRLKTLGITNQLAYALQEVHDESFTRNTSRSNNTLTFVRRLMLIIDKIEGTPTNYGLDEENINVD